MKTQRFSGQHFSGQYFSGQHSPHKILTLLPYISKDGRLSRLFNSRIRNMAAPSINPKTGSQSIPSKDKRQRLLEAAMKRHQYQPDALIEVLHKAQELFGYLSPELLQYVAKSLHLPLSQVYGVATFYHFFSLAPKGNHRCTICLGTACYVKGAAQLLAALEQHLGIQAGQTTQNNQMSLATARCLGACGIAPVVVIDDEMVGKQTPEAVVFRIDKRLDNNGLQEDSFEQKTSVRDLEP